MISWKGRVPANQLKLVVGGVPTLLTAAVISTCLAHSSDAHIPRTGEPAEGRALFLLDAGYRLPMDITAIRNVGKVQWVSELEVEVKNVSPKPIFGIRIVFYLPGVRSRQNGLPMSFYMVYGDRRLLSPHEVAGPADRPLEPGQTAVLKVEEKLARDSERYLSVNEVSAARTHLVRMSVLSVNLGDGTSFINGGLPFPGVPGAFRPQSRWLQVHLNGPTGSGVPLGRLSNAPPARGLIVPASFRRPLPDVCCGSLCDGSYSTQDQWISCNGCSLSAAVPEPCQANSCSIVFFTFLTCCDSDGVCWDCPWSWAFPCPPPPDGGGGHGGFLD
jgi:hypothetical protein